MSTGHDTSDFHVVAANRELKQRLAQAEHTAELLRSDLLNMTRVADQQYLSQQEAVTKFKWISIVVEHLQADKPLPPGWQQWSVNDLIKHVFTERVKTKRMEPKDGSENVVI